MDDRSIQFALFLGIAAALLVLLVVGIEVVRRAIALRRRRQAGEAPSSEALPSEALPSEALPSEALPSEALPSEALPSEAMFAHRIGKEHQHRSGK